MLDEILTAAGLEYKQGRFLRPPAGTYAVYFDDIETDGPDPLEGTPFAGLRMAYHHDVRVELYEAVPDPTAEYALERELDDRGLSWSKEDRYWLDDAKRYQVLYEFSYTSKERKRG